MDDVIDIPSHFLCPISLQLMRDPVTISTGITYDRDCIEKWLFNYKNNTCPVTKQPLTISLPSGDDDEFISLMITPNRTLCRLIQSWCTLHASDGVERIPTQPPSLTRAHICKLISNAKKCPEMRYACLQRIRSFPMHCSRTKKLLVSSGAFQFVASVLAEKDATGGEKGEAVSIMAQMDYGYDEEFKGVTDSCLGEVLRSESSSSHQDRENAIKVLRLVYRVADPTQLSNVKHEMFGTIVRILRDGDGISNQAKKNAFKLLVELNPWGRNRVKAVGAGAVHVLVELLLDDLLDRRISELALVVLDQLCGCAEGRADLIGHGAGLAVVSKKILRVSHVASDRAVRILSSISRYVRTAKVVGEMMEVGVVAKLCLVIQLMDSNSKTKQRAKQMLTLHSRAWKNSPCIPLHLISSYPSS